MFNGQQPQLLCYSSRLFRSNETERGTSQKRISPMAFQAQSTTQVCTGIRQNQSLFKTGHSPLISKLVQHINTQIHTLTC